MNNKTDGHSSSNEEVQSSGISSMSDETPPSENGTNFTESYSSQPSADRWKDECYICAPNQQSQSAIDYRYEHAEIAYPNASHSRQQNIIKPSPVNLGMTKSSAFSPRSMPPIENQFHAIREPPLIPGVLHYPNQTYNSMYEIDKSLVSKPSLFQSGFQVYTPYGDMERPYILDSDLETIEEESSVLESDFDDRGSIGYDRKRSSADFQFHRKHERSGSNNTLNSKRDSMTSATASDDERSSSTGSTRSAARSSWSSWGEPGTPRNENTNRNTDTESITPSKSSLQKQHTPRRVPSFENVAAIDPNAQQKIVYAKCLSPKEAAKSRNNTSVKIVNHISPTQVNNIPQSPKTHPASQQSQKHSTASGSVSSKKQLTITDMFEAVRNGDVQTLNKFSPPEQSETVDESGNTVLHAAAEAGQLQCVRLLATSTCVLAISLLNDDLMTPAALSVKNGHLCCVQWLVQNTVAKEELIVSSRQASIDGSNMRPPLAHVAARYDQDAVLDWLCEEMCQEKYSIDSADHHSNTSVHEAAAHGHLKCLQTLVGRGASVTVLNSNGDTPGQVADKNGHELCVGYLVVVESCMSLAQQLVTMKIDMESLRKDNENFRNQVKSLESARIAQAKDSVEQRINAALKKLSPHQEDNEMNDITPRNISTDEWSKGESIAERKILNSSQPTLQSNETMLPETLQDDIDPLKENNRKLILNTPASKHEKEQSNSMTNGIISDRIDYHSSIMHEDTQKDINKSSNGIAERQENRNYDEIRMMRNDVTQNGHSEQSQHNEEIENLTKTIEVNKETNLANNFTKTQAGRAWDKMTTDEMLRMARDTRYLPSPTVSMCTEDSTMETREVMRERLAEASRWFLGQQIPGHKKISPIKDPRTNIYKSHQRSSAQTYSLHSASPGTSRNQKSMNNTASWVRDVQRSKAEPRQQRSAGISNVHLVPQQFVKATNQQYKKLQLASNIYNKIQTKDSAEKNVDSQRFVASSSLSDRSPESASSNSLTLTSNTLSSTSSSVFLRPTSAKSSCSTTSTTRSSQFHSSSSSISNSTIVSQDTVVEYGESDAPTIHLRSNADLVHQQVRDPLKKQQTELHSNSQLNSSTSSIMSSVNSSISAPYDKRQDGSSRPTSATVTKSINQVPPNRFSSSDPVEICTILPSRNNSFLRKVQPSPSYPQQVPCSTTSYSDSSPPPVNTNVVTYPMMTTKPPSPADKRNFSQNVQRTIPTSLQKTPHSSSNVQYSSSAGVMQKVEIVHPGVKPEDNEPRRNVATNGRSFVMWRPSTTQIVRREDIVTGPKTEPKQESPKLTRKNKGSKHSKNKGDKQPYGGIFTSSSSPKSSSKRKPTKLFQI